jgi:hypothetical protein
MSNKIVSAMAATILLAGTAMASAQAPSAEGAGGNAGAYSDYSGYQGYNNEPGYSDYAPGPRYYDYAPRLGHDNHGRAAVRGSRSNAQSGAAGW